MAQTPTAADPQWRAAHIAYFGDGTDQLLLHAVRPVIERLADHVRSVYVLRHWRRGPHLRLVMAAEPAVFAAVVEPAVAEIVGGYLREHPSTAATPDEAALLPLHRRLADAEREPGPLTPFYADNSITWAEHDRRIEVLGCPVGADELALFYAGTNDLLFRHLAAVASGVPRETLALRLMLATAHKLCRHPADASVRRGFVSFRSHAEGYLSTVGPQVRSAFDQRYAANRDVLTAQVRAVVAAFDEAPTDGNATDGTATDLTATDLTATDAALAGGADADAETLHRWIAAIDPLGARWTALYAAGEIPEAEIPGDEENGIGDLLTASPMHRAIAGNTAYKEMMYRDPRFLRYRLMLNYTYLHLSRLGVPGLTRYLLCHLAANAVEEVYGVTALDLVLATVDAQPNPPTRNGPVQNPPAQDLPVQDSPAQGPPVRAAATPDAR